LLFASASVPATPPANAAASPHQPGLTRSSSRGLLALGHLRQELLRH
jgi:hypothetical protein